MKRNNNGYAFDHAERKIIITKGFGKRSSTIGSDEYQTLLKLRNDFPDYGIKQKTTPSTRKNTHKYLTLQRMGEHIATQDNSTARGEEFEKVKLFYKNNSAYYAKVKAWFLKQYSDYNNKEYSNNETDDTAA